MTMTRTRLRLGDMLVAAGIVAEAQIAEALERQKGTGRRLGEMLVELGHVTEHQLAQVLSNQLSIPWVNLHHVDFSRELLNLVPGDLAERAIIVPVYVRHVRRQGDTLFVATDDPMNDASLAQISAHVGMPVKPMVAGSTDVRNAIRAYYGRDVPGPAARVEKKKALIASLPPVELPELDIEVAEVDAPAAPPPSSSASNEAPAGASSSDPELIYEAPAVSEPVEESAEPPSAAPAEPSVATEAEPAPLVRKRKKASPKMITLTLLDGSKVRLPAPGSEATEEAEEQLTTRDLLAALIARTQGKDVSRVLPDAQWEPLFVTLLSLLMRKGLIADWEFVEEFGKRRARKT